MKRIGERKGFGEVEKNIIDSDSSFFHSIFLVIGLIDRRTISNFEKPDTTHDFPHTRHIDLFRGASRTIPGFYSAENAGPQSCNDWPIDIIPTGNCYDVNGSSIFYGGTWVYESSTWPRSGRGYFCFRTAVIHLRQATYSKT